jgi:hypothetical protein
MPVQTITAITGVAKQASKGTLAANPTFAHGLNGGSPISVEPTHSALEVTAGKRVSYNVIRESMASGASIEAPAYLKSLGLYLLGALGSVTTTGTGPYVHTFATGDLPYLSIFAKGLDTTIEAIRDCKIDELSIKWENAKPLTISVSAAGTVFSYPASFTATTDEVGSESFLVPVGGSFQIDTIGSSPVAARVVGGELIIKNNVTAIDPSSQIESDDVFEGIQEHELKLTIIPDNLSDFRKTITGSANGTTVSATAPIGSVALTFKENNGTGQLVVTGSKVAFATAFPDADPKGGAVEIELAGIPVMPAGGTAPLVYALTNAQATY